MPKVKDTITPALKNISKGLIDMPKKAHKYWQNITPIDTGNAKRKTRLSNDKIKANYDYASYLDNGHSKQAPKGMSKPTQDYVDKLIKSLFRSNK